MRRSRKKMRRKNNCNSSENSLALAIGISMFPLIFFREVVGIAGWFVGCVKQRHRYEL